MVVFGGYGDVRYNDEGGEGDDDDFKFQPCTCRGVLPDIDDNDNDGDTVLFDRW